jgi:hypothetical protein
MQALGASNATWGVLHGDALHCANKELVEKILSVRAKIENKNFFITSIYSVVKAWSLVKPNFKIAMFTTGFTKILA